MIAEDAARCIDVCNLLRIQKVLPRLQATGLASTPRYIAAHAEIVGELHFERAIDAHLITPLKGEEVEHRGSSKLTGIRLKVISLVIGRQFEGSPAVDCMITAHFKIVRALRPRPESRRIVRLCSGPFKIHLGKRDLLDIRRREQPSIVYMEDVGTVQLVCHPDAWAQ